MPPKAAAAPAKAAPKAAAPAKAAPAPAPKAAAPKAAAPKPAEKKPEAPKAKPAVGNGVYVKNWGEDGADVANAVFGSAGKITGVTVRRGKYCLVWFENSAAATKAISSFNNKEINGNVVEVSAAKTQPKAPKTEGSSVVFVSPIFRESTTRKTILTAFSTAGKIQKLRTYRQNFAYVYYDSAAAAQKAIKEKNGQDFQGHKLQVKLSTRKLESDKKRFDRSQLLVSAKAWQKKEVSKK
jgi:RNA recognition motif-containing protein